MEWWYCLILNVKLLKFIVIMKEGKFVVCWFYLGIKYFNFRIILIYVLVIIKSIMDVCDVMDYELVKLVVGFLEVRKKGN